MKPATAGIGMSSTTQPKRSSPMPKTMNPHMNAKFVAICGLDHSCGCLLSTYVIICETVRDMTATGPIEISLDVANNWREVWVCKDTLHRMTHAICYNSNKSRVKTILRWQGCNLGRTSLGYKDRHRSRRF